MITLRRVAVTPCPNRVIDESFLRRNRRILAKVIVPAGILAACITGPATWADSIFVPTDSILGGQVSGGSFLVGAVGGAGNTWPGGTPGEYPYHAIDGVGQKY